MTSVFAMKTIHVQDVQDDITNTQITQSTNAKVSIKPNILLVFHSKTLTEKRTDHGCLGQAAAAKSLIVIAGIA